jgi:hypothetical protein
VLLWQGHSCEVAEMRRGCWAARIDRTLLTTVQSNTRLEWPNRAEAKLGVETQLRRRFGDIVEPVVVQTRDRVQQVSARTPLEVAVQANLARHAQAIRNLQQPTTPEELEQDQARLLRDSIDAAAAVERRERLARNRILREEVKALKEAAKPPEPPKRKTRFGDGL